MATKILFFVIDLSSFKIIELYIIFFLMIQMKLFKMKNI